MRRHLPLFLLLLLALHPLALLAAGQIRWECSPRPVSSGLAISNCHSIIARMPYVPNRTTSSSSSNPIRLSSPFLPRANLVHQTCWIRINFWDGKLHPRQPMRSDYRWEHGPLAPENMAPMVWAQGRYTLQALLDRCLVQGGRLGGKATGSVAGSGLPNAMYSVHIDLTPPGGVEGLPEHQRAMQKMRGEARFSPVHTLGNAFRTATYSV